MDITECISPETVNKMEYTDWSETEAVRGHLEKTHKCSNNIGARAHKGSTVTFVFEDKNLLKPIFRHGFSFPIQVLLTFFLIRCLFIT